MFRYCNLIKCICCGVNYVDFNLLQVRHYSGTTQKPRDHFFQKSGLWGLATLHPKQQRTPQM